MLSIRVPPIKSLCQRYNKVMNKICLVDDCDREVRCRGVCNRCYQRANAGNESIKALLLPHSLLPKVCSVDGCDAKSYRFKMCRNHAKHWVTHGNVHYVMRGNTSVATLCNKGHVLDEENTMNRRSGKRRCRTCDRLTAKTRRAEMRAIVREARGTTCLNCKGTFEPSQLSFHHRDPTTKKGTISDMAGRVGEKKLREEIAKCDVLCHACHVEADYAVHARNPHK